ncbi:MAG: HK97 gp10 family phage protein [Candidatus Accumulibacter sp.]|uniref:HK97 gp10 family phage protein n=1 Tax=Accumulibacter sp. TaxID=2053492 RepID=UPI00258AB8DD|nr:HK97 gp10 family phage protein [Accumulibacter sp.]MCM8624134.1 HK97 gp10 family phage protein [Accumulibacter sp.]
MAEISGIAELRARLASGIARQREQLVADLDALGAQMVAEIRAAAPKRTGALAASVRHEVVWTPGGARLKIMAGTDAVYYAPFVEFGTAREPAYAFVRPVVYREEKAIPGRIERTLSTSWEQS